jgi:hypothetical protein
VWLELRPAGWIRLGRDVVGRRSAVTIERNRYGPPGRRVELEILYADGGARDACLREALLDGAGPLAGLPALAAPAAPPGTSRIPGPGDEAPSPPGPPPSITPLKGPLLSPDTHAPAAPALATPAPPPRAEPDGDAGPRRPLRLVAARPDRPRRTALDRRDRGGRGPARPGARRPAGDPARERTPARARGDLPRPRS